MKKFLTQLKDNPLKRKLFSFLVLLIAISGLSNSASAQCRTFIYAFPDSSGYTVQFFDSSSGGTPVSWAWDFGDGATSVQQAPNHSYTTSGWYQVCLTVTFNPACTATACDSVYIGTPVYPCIADFYQQVTGATSVSFNDLSTGGSQSIISWDWDFGDGSVSTQQSPSHTYASPGSYVACLTITTTGGQCTNSTCQNVVIQSSQTCSAYFGYNVQSGSYTADFIDTSWTSSGSITSWAWDFGDGSTSNLQNPSHTYATTGNYQVCLTITGINGCTDTYCSRVDILGPYCTSNFFSYGSNPLQASFVDNSSSSSTITGWAWDFGDGNTSNLQNPVHTYAAGGYFYVCLTISTNSGCNDTYCDSVYIGTSSSCQSIFSAQVNGGVVTFTDNSIPSNHSGLWDFGDGNTLWTWNSLPVNHQYFSVGTFVVCLTITDSLCYSTTCDTVVITQAGCSALFTSMQDSMNFLTTYFNDLSSGTINDWSWDFGDGSTGNGQYPVHTYASIGTYRVCLTVTDTLNSCTNTYCTNVVANSPCAPVFGAFPDSLMQTTVDMNFWLQSNCGSPTAVFWDFGDGTVDSSGTLAPIHSYADTGTYTVCACVVIGIDTFCDCEPVYAYRMSSGIADVVSPVQHFTAAPNPFHEGTTVSFDINQQADVELKLVDLLGNEVETVYSGHTDKGAHQVSLFGKNMSPGIYFIHLKVNGYSTTQKIFFLP